MAKTDAATWNKKSFACLFSGTSLPLLPIQAVQCFKGEPTLFLSSKDIQKLAVAFALSLVGKFFCGRSSMEEIRRAVQTIEFKSNITIGFLDIKHVFLRPSIEEDYFDYGLRGSGTFLDIPLEFLNGCQSLGSQKNLRLF